MSTSPGRPVFIVGCPRSGTTWLYHLLLSSGGFAIYRSETQLYDRFAPAFRGFRSPASREAFLRQWLGSEFFLRAGLDAGAFRLRAMAEANSPGAMLRVLMNMICREQGAERWAECTPAHGLYIREIKRDFPDALFIHITRDGRDVALSLARQRFIAPFPWQRQQPELAAAAYWAWITRRIRQQGDALGRDLLDLRYEDLVDDLAGSLDRIGGFIGRPIDAARIRRNAIGAVDVPNSSFADGAGAVAGQPGRQANIDPAVILKTEAIMAPGLEALGYPLTAERPTGLRAAAARTTRAAYAARFALGRGAKGLGLQTSAPQITAASDRRDEDRDPTLRPNQHLERIRAMVQK